MICFYCRCPHINFTGNICVYCPGGPDSDFEYSTQEINKSNNLFYFGKHPHFQKYGKLFLTNYVNMIRRGCFFSSTLKETSY